MGATEPAPDGWHGYWGKASDESPAQKACHLLAYHCLDVAAVGAAFIEQDNSLARALAGLESDDRTLGERLCLYLLALHDVGKFSGEFQGLLPDLAHRLSGRTPLVRYGEPHGNLGLALWRILAESPDFPVNLGIPVKECDPFCLCDLPTQLAPLAYAVFGHHGKPPVMDKQEPKSFFAEVELDHATGFIQDAAGFFFAGYEGPGLDPEPYDEKTAAWNGASWTLAGLCVLCDWIGSNTEYFPYVSRPMALAEYWNNHALPRARDAVARSGVLSPQGSPWRGFSALFPEIAEPTPLQAEVSSREFPDGPCLLIFEDITGSGKTEAALAAVHRMMDRGLGQSLYVGMPTMATSNAMYERMGRNYRRLFTGDSLPSLVLAHGARELSRAFTTSIALENTMAARETTDEQDSAAAVCSAWLADNRKKALLGAVGVGTLDQALLSVLPVRHQSLRLFGLRRGILVADEVHAYDAYTHRLLCTLLEFQAAAGGSAVLLSATLPVRMRKELVNAWRKGAGASRVELECADYPLATYAGLEQVREVPVEAAAMSRRRVGVRFVESPENAVELLVAAARAGACACYIRNTVDNAREAHETAVLELGVENAILFHARFAMGDRAAVEEKVLRLFGKDSDPSARAGRVVVATQVVEQSLDLDFDLVVTDLAPVELLIQRAGRCQRHARERPEGYETPTMAVVSPEPEPDAGSEWYRGMFPRAAGVYPSHGRLWRAARLLRDMGGFSMPDDLRTLVEGVYDDAALEAPEALGELDFRHEGAARGDASMADMNVLRVEKGYRMEETPWDEDIHTPTRLGEQDTLVRLARIVDGVIVPWAEEPRAWLAWRQSEIRVNRRRVAACPRPEDVSPDAWEEAVASMPGKGKWSELLVLTEAEDGWFTGTIEDNKGTRATVRYSRRGGLVFQ